MVMKRTGIKIFLLAVLIGGAALLGRQIMIQFQEQESTGFRAKGPRSAPVEVANIERGQIRLRRTFTGTLEARTEFVAAPKVGGRIRQLAVDIADTVTRGQIVAKLDNDEYVQAVAQARADLAVAKANLADAGSALRIANKDFQRIKTLQRRGIVSDSQFDEATARQLSMQARSEVAKAQVNRAEALLETANIRLGYTNVTVDWTDGDNQRIVAERYVDEGHTVSANAPLFRIVEFDPITGVISVTEKDYARMHPGQTARLTTDAYPEEVFEGRIVRISPVFRQETRQVRVELTIANLQHRLKPGMFIRAEVELESLPDAIIIPEQALTKRAGQTGVFVVSEERHTVVWHAVKAGIREGNRVQVTGQGLSGRVVTLGHQLVDDGSPIIIPDESRKGLPSGEGEKR